MPRAAGETFSGVSASGGLAIGVTRQYRPRTITVEDQPGDPLTEGNRFQAALTAAQGELESLYEEVKTRLGSGKAAIFRVHAELLSDAGIIQQTILLVYQRHSAAWAWQQVINERVSQMQKLDDPVLAGRAVDLSDVGQRVLQPQQTALLVGACRVRIALAVANADGSQPQIITKLTGENVSRPVWSPDGKTIAFASDDAGNEELYTILPDGSNQTRLTNNTMVDRAPDWQPTCYLRACLALNPAQGPAGTVVTVTGLGYGPNEQVSLRFAWGSHKMKVGTAMTDSTGAFSVQATIPAGATGTGTMSGTGATSLRKAGAKFKVT